MVRLVSYLKHKLNIPARIPPTILQPQLSKTVTLQTSFPEACTVCSKHLCEVDFKHKLVHSVDEAFNKTFKDLKEKTDQQIAKYSTDLEQELSKILKLP